MLVFACTLFVGVGVGVLVCAWHALGVGVLVCAFVSVCAYLCVCASVRIVCECVYARLCFRECMPAARCMCVCQ